MPFIQTRTNKSISEEQKVNIKSRLGEAITLIGKSESWLMLDFVPDCNMFFKGNNNIDMAYIDVKLYGNASDEACNNMTKAITNIISSELDIDPSNIYVSYIPISNWGWNGSNF